MNYTGCIKDVAPNETDTELVYVIAKHIKTFASFYNSYHVVYCVILIITGISLGIINIIILNFRRMVSPTNRILSCIGIADLVTLANYTPYVIYFYVVAECGLLDFVTRTPAIYLSFYITLMAISHFTSIWLAIGLAGLRIHCMRNPQQSEAVTWRLMKIITITIVVIACSTSYVYITNTEIVTVLKNTTINNELITVSRFNIRQSTSYLIIYHGVAVKLLPSIVLTIMVILMIKEIHQFKQLRKGLGKSSNIGHTTNMLIGIVVLFIILELPQGIIILISALNDTFYDEIYYMLGDFLDAMSLTRTVANFFIYCAMSAMFRQYLMEIICCKVRNSTKNVGGAPTAHSNVNNVHIKNNQNTSKNNNKNDVRFQMTENTKPISPTSCSTKVMLLDTPLSQQQNPNTSLMTDIDDHDDMTNDIKESIKLIPELQMTQL